MRVFFFLGWAFLILAFAAAAADAIPRGLPGDYGLFISAYDLWYAAWPGSLVVAQIRVERLSTVLWDPVLVGLLAFPTWFLFLLPGGLLTWFCRPHKEMSEALREDMQKREESLLLFDHLVRQAEEAGYTDGDDQAPNHEAHDLIEAEGGVHPHSDDSLLEELDFGEEDGEGPPER